MSMVLYQQDGAVVTITLNDPAKRNPISEQAMVDAIIAGLARLDSDHSVRVAILTGAGSAFSSGGDLLAMRDAVERRAGHPHETADYYRDGIQRIPLAFERLSVPIIAAVNGPAIGAGLDLACMCDIRIAAESAVFAESFVKVGLIAGDGGAWLLPRAVGYSKACEMAFTGEPIGAPEALACGLVSRVVADADLLGAARALADRIAANPAQAVRLTKRLLLQGRQASLGTLLELAASMQSLMHATDEHREAVARFLDRRRGG